MSLNRLSRNEIGIFVVLLLVLPLVLSACVVEAPAAQQVAAPAEGTAKFCEGLTIRFFAGGEAGDAFASIVHKGALAAAADTGANVEYVFSGWQIERMLDQLRDAIAAQPDGIAMMGHPGDDALMPLAEQAAEAGILMMYQNVDVPEVRKQFGGGYVGANLTPQGYALGAEAIRQFDLQEGDRAVVYGAWDQPGRFYREEGTAQAFEDIGMVVERITARPEWSTDPNLMIPSLTASILDHPETRVIVYPGGQLLGAVSTFMEALEKEPGEIINIGFDTSPAVIEAFRSGNAQLTSDQQPFLQGYIPILSLCMSKVYGLGPMNLDTGAGFVDASNFEDVAELAEQGYR
jgi:simple sugar transport system substrate-binding protein